MDSRVRELLNNFEYVMKCYRTLNIENEVYTLIRENINFDKLINKIHINIDTMIYDEADGMLIIGNSDEIIKHTLNILQKPIESENKILESYQFECPKCFNKEGIDNSTHDLLHGAYHHTCSYCGCKFIVNIPESDSESKNQEAN